jgi:hypothetical protein
MALEIEVENKQTKEKGIIYVVKCYTSLPLVLIGEELYYKKLNDSRGDKFKFWEQVKNGILKKVDESFLNKVELVKEIIPPWIKV